MEIKQETIKVYQEASLRDYRAVARTMADVTTYFCMLQDLPNKAHARYYLCRLIDELRRLMDVASDARYSLERTLIEAADDEGEGNQ